MPFEISQRFKCKNHMREQILESLKKEKTSTIQPRLSDISSNKPIHNQLLNLRKIKSVDFIEIDKNTSNIKQ